MEKKTFLQLSDEDRKKINENFVSRLGLSEEQQKDMLDAMSEGPKLTLDAEWEINYWKSGSGFSHSEVVEHSVEEVVLTPEEMKESLRDWWYENDWTDTNYDGHYWKVTYTKDGKLFDQEECWVYPEDI